jgi:hypothetical protein
VVGWGCDEPRDPKRFEAGCCGCPRGFEAASDAKGFVDEVVAVPPKPEAIVLAGWFCEADPPNSDPAAVCVAAAAPPNSVPACEGAEAVFPNKLPPCVAVAVDVPKRVPADVAVELELPKRPPPDLGGKRLTDGGGCEVVLQGCWLIEMNEGGATYELAAAVFILSPPGGPFPCPNRLPMAAFLW